MGTELEEGKGKRGKGREAGNGKVRTLAITNALQLALREGSRRPEKPLTTEITETTELRKSENNLIPPLRSLCALW
jgi:hypothetical protein